MKEYLLKRALPFALTFAVGAAVGGFFQLFGAREAGWRAKGYTYTYGGRRGCGKKFRRVYAPESKPPVILFKPDALLPQRFAAIRPVGGFESRPVRVTFGDDGKVRDAKSLVTKGRYLPELDEAAERAARQIQFIPATLDGAPTTVTEDVEIRFSFQ